LNNWRRHHILRQAFTHRHARRDVFGVLIAIVLVVTFWADMVDFVGFVLYLLKLDSDKGFSAYRRVILIAEYFRTNAHRQRRYGLNELELTPYPPSLTWVN